MPADGSIGADADPSRWRDARAWFQTRRPVLRESAAQTERDARLRAFRVAGITSVNLVTEVHQAIDDALRDGTTLDEFKKRVGAKLAEEWGAPNARRVETIFRTNVQSAYNAGRYAEMTRPAVLAVRPFWKFVAILDGRTTATCAPLNGVIRKHDDAFWESHFPPLHFNCRSTVVSLSRGEAERAGGVKEPPKAKAPGAGFGTRPDLAGDGLAETEAAAEPVRAAARARVYPATVRTDREPVTLEERERAVATILGSEPFSEIIEQTGVAYEMQPDVVRYTDAKGNTEEAIAIFDPNTNTITQSLLRGPTRGIFNARDSIVDEGARTPAEAYARILVHELGHALLGHSGEEVEKAAKTLWVRAVRRNACVSARARKNEHEYFAEAFSAYFFEPEELRRVDPRAYKMVRDILRARGIDYDPSTATFPRDAWT